LSFKGTTDSQNTKDSLPKIVPRHLGRVGQLLLQCDLEKKIRTIIHTVMSKMTNILVLFFVAICWCYC